MTCSEAAEIVKALKISKPVIARLSAVHDFQVYNYLDGKATTTLNAYKITTTIGELSRWIQALPFPPDMRNWRAVADALGKYRIDHLREAGAQAVREEFGPVVTALREASKGDYLEAATQARLTELGVTAGSGSKK